MPARKLPNKDFLWTPKLAYAVGLITDDGSLSKDGRHIVFTSVDTSLIRTFKKCLGLTNRITKTPKSSISKRQGFRVQFGNIQFYNWLIRIGLKPNKASSLGKIIVPGEVFPDFLRGHLDGDGSVFTYIDRYNTYKNPKYVYTRLYVYFISTSKDHIRWLQTMITKLKGLKGSIQKGEYGRGKLYVLKFSKKEAIKLLSWVYYKPNIPCLKRKYNIAKPFLENRNKGAISSLF
jgi:hypothetical protein